MKCRYVNCETTARIFVFPDHHRENEECRHDSFVKLYDIKALVLYLFRHVNLNLTELFH